MPQFEALGFQVIGLSIDSKFSQKAFAEKLELNFPLVADANRDASPQLGTMLQEVAGIRNVNMRSAMLIDSGMTLRWKFGVDAATQPNVEQVLGEVRRLMGNA